MGAFHPVLEGQLLGLSSRLPGFPIFGLAVNAGGGCDVCFSRVDSLNVDSSGISWDLT
jgi:hypothetical protein